ncbi:MAG: SAM-dependent chlorinase/fluorinase [Ilumatobacteraceae bacterium]
MGRRYDTVSLLSDLGTRDELIGVVRAVIADLAPHARLLDLTHEIAPFDIRAGSLALARAISYVPAGVVLASVDPGALIDRPCVAVEVADGAGVLVGPDNGLLAPAVAMAGGAGRCVLLDDDTHHLGAPGSTFAARDVLAPVAAQLCNGVDLTALGTEVDAGALVPGIVPLPRDEDGTIVCEVLWIDRFGNCQLNVGPDEVVHLGDRIRVQAGDPASPTVRSAAMVGRFADVGVGAIGMLVDAYGMLTLALDRRSASDELGVAAGDLVVLSSGDDRPSAGVTTPISLRPPQR